MSIRWSDLNLLVAGRRVTLSGHPVALSSQSHAARFLITQEPGCCPGCAPRDPAGTIEIQARSAIPLLSGSVHLSGVWSAHDGAYRLTDAHLAEPVGWSAITRRRALAAGPLMCLAAAVDIGSARAAIQAITAVDFHSHAGGIANMERMRTGRSFSPVAEPMRKGGMAAVCLAIVGDSGTHKVMTDGRLHPFRDPAPGELYALSQLTFARVNDMARAQGMAIVTNAAALRAARAGTASAIIAAEGGDFLEGRPDRVDEAYTKWSLRHLQLTHYRVNELGDIQTEPPVHGA